MLWTDFHNEMLPTLPGVPAELVNQQLRITAIDFCTATYAYKAASAPVDIVSGTAAYPLVSPDSGTEIVALDAVWVNERPVHPTTDTALSAAYTYWPGETAEQARSYLQVRPDQVVLFPQPSLGVTSGLKMRLVLRPTRTSTGLVDWFATRYFDTLVAGAKARLCAMPSKPWTDTNAAQMNAASYAAGRIDAVVDRNRGFTTGTLQVVMRKFA